MGLVFEYRRGDKSNRDVCPGVDFWMGGGRPSKHRKSMTTFHLQNVYCDESIIFATVRKRSASVINNI
jgi:hypothetical protein